MQPGPASSGKAPPAGRPHAHLQPAAAADGGGYDLHHHYLHQQAGRVVAPRKEDGVHVVKALGGGRGAGAGAGAGARSRAIRVRRLRCSPLKLESSRPLAQEWEIQGRERERGREQDASRPIDGCAATLQARRTLHPPQSPSTPSTRPRITPMNSHSQRPPAPWRTAPILPTWYRISGYPSASTPVVSPPTMGSSAPSSLLYSRISSKAWRAGSEREGHRASGRQGERARRAQGVKASRRGGHRASERQGERARRAQGVRKVSSLPRFDVKTLGACRACAAGPPTQAETGRRQLQQAGRRDGASARPARRPC